MHCLRRGALSTALVLLLLFVEAGARGSPALAHFELKDDPRLAVGVSVACKDRPLGQVLPVLGDEIGVRLRAGSDTADDRATLLLDERPAGEVMALLARHFDFQWVRSGESYELVQSGESKGREAALRRQEMERQLAALYAEMEKPPPLAGTPRRLLEQRESEIDHLLESEELDEGAQARLEKERSATEETLHPGREPARAMFRSLTAEQIGHLLEERDLWLSSADGTLPPRLAGLVRQAEIEAARRPRWRRFFENLGEERWPPGETEVVLRLIDAVPFLGRDQPRDAPALGLLFLIPYGPEELRQRAALVGWSAAGRLPIQEKPPPTMTDDPVLLADWGLQITAQADLRSPSASLTLGDVAGALREATGLEVVSDSFISSRVSPELCAALQRQQPLVQALDRLADELDYTWRKEGNVLFLRSRTYYRDRLEEVPERLLGPWRARVLQQGTATLDDLAALALSLTDAQARGMERHWDSYLARTQAAQPSSESGGFYGSRHHLRLWGSLAPLQRRRLFRGEILPVASMSPWQIQCFCAALEAPKQWLFMAQVSRPPAPLDIASGGFSYRPPLSTEWSGHTFVYYLVGEREPAREVEVEITVPADEGSEGE